MLELDCPRCDEALLVAVNAAQLRCEPCAITVEIDADPADRTFVLPAAA